MRMDVEKIAFTTVANGGTVAEIDVSDAFQVGFAVDLDSVAGAFGTATFFALPLEDQAIGALTITGNEHIRKTADMGAVGMAFLGQRGTAVAEIAFENIYKKIRVALTLVTATSATGSLYVFRKRF